MEESGLQFKLLLGHQKAKSLLQEAIARKKLGHAYLFRGPDGVGKKRAALTLAATLNCKNPMDHDACGRCSSCRKYGSFNHPDLLLISPEGAAIKIGQVRELKRQLAFPPLEAETRVIILEDVHSMRREAANSLLKTLEEPAPNNLLILTADQAGEILSTILSRCQLIPFGPLNHEEMARVLMQENELDEAEAIALAAVAEGSLGRAKMLLEENLLSLRQEIIELFLFSQNDPAETVPRVLRLSDKCAALKENTYELLALLRLWFRDLVLIAAGAPETSAANKDLSSCLHAAKTRWSISQLHQRFRLIDRAEKQLLRNCSRTLVLETLFFGLI